MSFDIIEELIWFEEEASIVSFIDLAGSSVVDGKALATVWVVVVDDGGSGEDSICCWGGSGTVDDGVATVDLDSVKFCLVDLINFCS